MAGRGKLIVIGLDVFFADSFLWFKENGWSVTVLTHAGHTHWSTDNTALYEGMGFRIIKYDRDAFWGDGFRFDELALDGQTLILAGPNFEGEHISIADDLGDSTLYDLWLLQALAAYNRRHGLGAMVVRFHNGDTGFGSQEMADLYGLGLKDVDILLFDNDVLREFILFNAPSLKAKPSRLLWLEGPLKRHTRRNEGRTLDFICLGRFICDRRLNLPVLHFPMDRARHYAGLAGLVKPRYQLSIGKSLDGLANDRAAFADDLRGAVFGLDHFNGIFTGGRQLFERHKEFFFSPDGQRLTQGQMSKEMYWGFCNCPSKIAVYLMYGIIPVVSHTLHNVYQELADKKMAVPIERAEDLKRLAAMSDGEIERYRENIQAHADLFTFDRKAEFLVDEFEKFRAGANRWPGRPVSAAPDSDRAFDALIRKCLRRHQENKASPVASSPPPQHGQGLLSAPPALTTSPWLDKWWVKGIRAVSPKLVDAWLIAVSGAFDAPYYFLHNPGLLKKRRNPILGYVRKGAQQGRNPNAWFDTRQYLTEHPEAVQSGLNPLVHYLYVHGPAQGKKEAR